jgi:LmbE family N-acetylglucosaminyl deacetylase
VPLRNQIYLELPDGELSDHIDVITSHITSVMCDVSPRRVFTTGTDGYDGHPDHIGVHDAAMQATQVMRALGQEAIAWALAANHEGELRVGGRQDRKVGAMALHLSQRTTRDMTRWGNTDLYTPLIVGAETYARVI